MAMHNLVIGLFINRYEFGLPVEIRKSRSVTPPSPSQRHVGAVSDRTALYH
jgi:hypothetical protein